MLRCRLKYRNISSRRRESSDRYADFFVVGSTAAQPLAPVAGSNCGRGQQHLCQRGFDLGTRYKARARQTRLQPLNCCAVSELGFEILPVTGSHAEHAGGLPRHHSDPFDRLLIAQAYLEGMVLGTQDRRMQPYGVATLGLD
jgi:hypothetical protein